MDCLQWNITLGFLCLCFTSRCGGHRRQWGKDVWYPLLHNESTSAGWISDQGSAASSGQRGSPACLTTYCPGQVHTLEHAPKSVHVFVAFVSLNAQLYFIFIFYIIYFILSSCLSSYTSKERGDSASPKFIVTLDGVPSPLGNLADCDMELDNVRLPTKVTEATVHLNREPKVSIHHRLQGIVTSAERVWSSLLYFSMMLYLCKTFWTMVRECLPVISLSILFSSDRWRDWRWNGGWGHHPCKETESHGALQVLASL